MLLLALHSDLGDVAPIPGRVRSPAIAPRKTKLPAAPANVGLGVHTDLGAVHLDHAVYFSPSPGHIQNILDLFRQCLDAGKMSATVAATLVGKLSFVCRTTYGKVGRAALLPFIQRATRDLSAALTAPIVASMDFYRALFKVLPPVAVPLAPNPLPPITLFTDASFRMLRRRKGECSSKRQRFKGELGFVMHDPLWGPGVYKYGSAIPRQAVLDTFAPDKKTYIAQLEALAAVSAYFTHRGWFRGRHVNHWIDNTVALSALLHGSARTTDLALMTSAFHLQLAALRTTVFFDWVPSLANLADDPSRGDLTTLRRMGATSARMDTPTFTQWMAPLERWAERML